MKLTRRPFVSFCCLSLMAGIISPAQEPPASGTPAPQEQSGPSHAPGQILLNVVVTDKQGQPVSGLTRSDFAILDNNHPDAIESFAALGGGATASGPPVQIVLIIDSVNARLTDLAATRTGIDQFLHSNSGHLVNPVSIFWFTSKGLEAVGSPTTDGNDLATHLDATEEHIRTVNSASGATGAMERLQMSVRMMGQMANAAASQPGRKLLIWIGPDWPMPDRSNMQMSPSAQQGVFRNIVEVSRLLREAQMSIYSVTLGMPDANTFAYRDFVKGVKNSADAYLPNLDLRVLAVQSGGQALIPSNDLPAQIQECVRDAAAYYAITFTPPKPGAANDYHELKVRVEKPGTIVRTTTGYYSQPPGK